MNYYGLLLQAKEKYPWGVKTAQGKSIGEIRWNKDLTRIVSDTITLYILERDEWTEITEVKEQDETIT